MQVSVTSRLVNFSSRLTPPKQNYYQHIFSAYQKNAGKTWATIRHDLIAEPRSATISLVKHELLNNTKNCNTWRQTEHNSCCRYRQRAQRVLCVYYTKIMATAYIKLYFLPSHVWYRTVRIFLLQSVCEGETTNYLIRTFTKPQVCTTFPFWC